VFGLSRLIGIRYNPKRMNPPPTSWDDPWDPKYKGRVAITSLASTLGTALLLDVALEGQRQALVGNRRSGDV